MPEPSHYSSGSRSWVQRNVEAPSSLAWNPSAQATASKTPNAQFQGFLLAPLHTPPNPHFPARASLCSNNLPSRIANQQSRLKSPSTRRVPLIFASPNNPSQTASSQALHPKPFPRPDLARKRYPATLRYRGRRPPRRVPRVLPPRSRRRPPTSPARSPQTAAAALTMKSRRTPESPNPD